MKKDNIKIKKPVKPIILRILFVTLAILTFLILSAIIFWFSVDYDLDLNAIESVTARNVYFDSSNNEINSNGNGRFIEYSNFHDYTINCFISTEDRNFFKHKGIDVKRIVKAISKNITSFSYKEGASTITQQLIKNSQLSSKKTISRKYKEIKLALKLEKRLSKERIMELYLNSIYFGKNCYGIENAAKYYFNKSAADLNLNESAVLAGLIKSPATYSPTANLDKCIQRRNTVLDNLLQCGYIDNLIYEAEMSQPISVDITGNENLNYAYMEAANEELLKIFNINDKDLASLGLKIYTYLDSDMQNVAYKLLNNREYYPEYYDFTNNGIVLIENDTNGVSVFTSNNALDLKNIKRQPGSAIKPLLVYMPAFENNTITATTLIRDEKTIFEDYSPSNFNDEYYGDVTVRFSIKKSLNIPAIKTLNYIGVEEYRKYAQKLNLPLNKNDDNLSVALGGLTDGVSLLDLTAGYTALSNSGEFSKPKFILKIEDKNGNILYENHVKKQRVFTLENSFIMTDILMDSVNDGTANKLKTLPFDVASKTGTVGNDSGNTDGYNISYTTKHTLGIWTGSKTGTFGQYIMGGTTCSYLARDFYLDLYNDKIPEDFITPNGVKRLNIDSENLKVNHEIALATDDTPNNYILAEYFSSKNMPNRVSTYFENIKVISADVDLLEKYPYIKFTALSYASYEIYRNDGKNKELIKTIENKSGIIEIFDKTVLEGKTYEYTIIPYFKSEKDKKKIDKGIYTSEKIIIPVRFIPQKNSDEDKLNDNDDEKNLDWWQTAI